MTKKKVSQKRNKILAKLGDENTNLLIQSYFTNNK